MDIDEPTSTFIESQEGADDDWEEDQPYQPSASTSALPPPSIVPPSSSTGQADKEWSTMREKYTNDGFREGITSGKLSTLQSGFDSGYLLSSLPSRQLGNLRGRASALLALLLLPPPSSTSSSSSPSSTPTTFSRSTTTRSSSTSSSSHLTSHLDPPTRSLLIEDVRSLVRDLGRIKMLDVVGRDLEADEHTKTHGEGGEGGAEWQEGGLKEMDELEGLMEGMSGAVGREKEKDGLGERGEGGKLDLGVEGVVERRLRELMRRAVGGKGREEGGMEM